MKKLPFLVSIPHGGTKRPKELEGHLTITDRDLFDDSDPFVMEIYGLDGKVIELITTEIARAFVDLNRSIEDLPPKNPDGLIKSSTCYKKPIYIRGKEPDENLINQLIQRYYNPYHHKIQSCIDKLNFSLGLDCHSMATFAPEISPDGNQKERPLFCLSNQDGRTSHNKIIENLADSISESFMIDRRDISLNDPFHGGYITKTYGNNPIPWIQIEMNRSFYLKEPWFDFDSLQMDAHHLKKLNRQFEESLNSFYDKMGF